MSPVNVPAIGAFIREQREQAKISLRQLAQTAGVSNPYLSQIERGLRRPSADILQQIAKGLRISAEALYVQAGFLDDRPPGAGVRDAVLGDPDLTERQKQMLLDVYDSFRKESAERARTVLAGETVPPGEPDPEDGTAPGQPGDAGAEHPGRPGKGGPAKPGKAGRADAGLGEPGPGENVPPGGPGEVA
jgi:transcriptional regulator with XRE-family HTH domain